MDVLVERLSFGIDLKGLELAKLRIRGLGRGYISRLVQNGYDSPKALSELSIQELEMVYLLSVFYWVMDRETNSLQPNRISCMKGR